MEDPTQYVNMNNLGTKQLPVETGVCFTFKIYVNDQPNVCEEAEVANVSTQ